MTRLERLLIEKIDENNQKYQLWTNSEPLVIAISGGKDSLSLYSLMKKIHNHLLPVHLRIINENLMHFTFKEETQIIETGIYSQAKEKSKKGNCCFNCSRLRRKALLEFAKSNQAHKILLAHTLNDTIETLLLNMLFSREISTLKSRQELFNGEYELIRPMYNIEDKLIKSYVKEKQFDIMVNLCPENNNSKRAYIRNLLTQIQSDHPHLNIYDNLFASIQHIKKSFLPFKIED